MIVSLFWLLCFISTAFGTVTKIYDIETVIKSYLSHTIDEHALHGTSYEYMQVIQDESNLTHRYFQSVRYIKYGFPMYTNATNDNNKIYKKLNFIQSIAYYYCGINMSYVMNTSLDNIWINESQLYMNSPIFPVQLVESYELIRSEICHRIGVGLHQSVVDMFNTYSHVDSFSSSFIQHVANFLSFNTSESLALRNIGQVYPFLAKFGEFESYKEIVIHHILKINNQALASNVLDKITSVMSNIDISVNQIMYPKMHGYVTSILKSKTSESFILNKHNTSNFWYYVQMYQLSTGKAAIKHQVENTTIETHDLLQLLDECWGVTKSFIVSATMADCILITFGIYESCEDGTDGHEYVLDAIKCIISNHDMYCSKFSSPADTTDFELKSKLRNSLRKLLPAVAFYPYFNEIINDTQFVNIVNNNTDSQMDEYLHEMLSRLMSVALENYKDIEMIKRIVTLFKPKINVCTKCIFQNKYKYEWNLKMLSWMDVLVSHECTYLTNYFQQEFMYQMHDCSTR